MEFDIPRPGPEHAILAELVGNFEGTDIMMPSPWSPEKQERTSEISARMLDGFFAISNYEQKAGDQVTFRGHGVYSWDPKSRCYKMYWFDSMGGAGGVADGHLEGRVLTFQNQSPMGHHRYRYTFGDGETVFEMAMSADGEAWQTLMEGRYRRV